MTRKPKIKPKQINLALQGGGAHGAFTWGVLDRLLEHDEIEIAAISGTSAGALNGVALKAGMVRNGRAGAKAALDDGGDHRCAPVRMVAAIRANHGNHDQDDGSGNTV